MTKFKKDFKKKQDVYYKLKNVVCCTDLLCMLCDPRVSVKDKKKLVESTKLFPVMVEIAHNVLNKTVKYDQKDYSDFLRVITSPKIPLDVKSKIFRDFAGNDIQKGGGKFFQSTVAPLLVKMMDVIPEYLPSAVQEQLR